LRTYDGGEYIDGVSFYNILQGRDIMR